VFCYLFSAYLLSWHNRDRFTFMFGMHVREEKGIGIFVGKQIRKKERKLERKKGRKKERPSGRCKHRCEDNNKKDLKG